MKQILGQNCLLIFSRQLEEWCYIKKQGKVQIFHSRPEKAQYLHSIAVKNWEAKNDEK
jgi:hypothetical protein